MKTLADVMADASSSHRKNIRNGYTCDWCHRRRPRKKMLLGNDKKDQRILMWRGYDGNRDGAPWPEAECRTDREACSWYARLWLQVHEAIGDFERGRVEVVDDEE